MAAVSHHRKVQERLVALQVAVPKVGDAVPKVGDAVISPGLSAGTSSARSEMATNRRSVRSTTAFSVWSP